MTSLLSYWKVEDRLKTLAFALAGWGPSVSFWAGRVYITTSPWQVLGLMMAGFVLSAAAVVVALEIGNRNRRRL